MKKETESSSPVPKSKRGFHYSLLVFSGVMILTFLLWAAYVDQASDIEKRVAGPLLLIMGSLFSCAAGLFVWSLETRDDFLQKEVNKRTLELEEKNRELTAKSQEIENFIHIVSHDLKAPLVSIQGFASMMKNELGERLEGSSADFFNRIVANVKQMSTLLQDLLEFSRVGRMEDEKEEVDMGRLFHEILQDLKPEAEKKKIEVVSASDFPKLWGSKRRIHQAFMNLIGNAVKYSKEPDPKVELGVEDRGDFFEFFVRDNGVGIPLEAQGKVFQIFQRFHPKLQVEGTGVGLSIVKKIVELNGGKVRFESRPGEGTTFFVSWSKAH